MTTERARKMGGRQPLEPPRFLRHCIMFITRALYSTYPARYICMICIDLRARVVAVTIIDDLYLFIHTDLRMCMSRKHMTSKVCVVDRHGERVHLDA